MNNLPRLLKIASQRIARNPYNALAAVFVMFLAFFVAGVFVILSVGSNMLLRYFESRPQVTAFLKDDTSIEEVRKIEETLRGSGVVSKTKYVSKEAALSIFKERFKSEAILTYAVTAEILPASIEVSTYKLDDLEKVASIIEKESAVEEVVFQKAIVDTLSAWSKSIRNIGVGVVSFLLLTSFLITLIVIGLNIALHKDEIEIMKLVGATSWYIRIPFLIEGAFYGVISALFASFFLWIIYIWGSPILAKSFAGIPLLPAEPVIVFAWLVLSQMIVGTFIGVFGSFVATRKYLNV